MKKIQLTFLLFISVFVNAQIAINNPSPYSTCDDDFDGHANFNLLTKNQEILGSLNSSLYTVSYHYTLDGAENSTDMVYPESYYNDQPFTEIIYIRVEENTNTSNFSTTTLTLVVNPLPSVYPANNLTVIDTPYDGLATFDLTQQNATILGGQANCVVDYYDMNGNIISNPSSYTTTDAYGEFVDARVRNIVTGCQNDFPISFELKVEFSINTPTPYMTCELDYDGKATIDLTQKDTEILGSNSPDMFYIEYYETLLYLQNYTNQLNNEEYTNTTPNNQTIYFRVISQINNLQTTGTLNLIVYHKPIANNISYHITDSPYDGVGTFNLTTQTSSIMGVQANCSLALYSSLTDAENNINPITNLTSYTNSTNPQILYSKVTNNITGCYSIGNLNLIVDNPNHIIFPDSNFKAKLLEASTENYIAHDENGNSIIVDTNGDGEIQQNEALTVWKLYTNDINIFDLSGIEYFTNLNELYVTDAKITTLILNTLTNLTILDCTYNSIRTLDVTNLTNLQKLYCGGNKLTDINITPLTQLTDFYFDENYINTINLNLYPNLTHLGCGNNHINNLDVSSLINLTQLSCFSNGLSSLNLGTLANLTFLDCSDNNLTSINFNSSANLNYLNCSFNSFSTLNLSNHTNLQSLYCFNNEINTLDLTPLINLTTLNCSRNPFTSLNVTPLVNLNSLECSGNHLTSLNLTPLTNLNHLDCSGNQISNIDIASLPQLGYLFCGGNPITSLNVSQLTNLAYLSCPYTQITTIDVSHLTNLNHFNCSGNPNLTQVFIKNGFNYELVFNGLYRYYLLNNCPNLQYVCANDNKVASLVNYFGQNNMQNVVVNSYCSFTPGGAYNTIAGNVKFDANNNGCDNLDAANPFINIKLNDGNGFAYSATNTTGNYNFYTQPGNFVVAPNIENPSWFTISPTSANIPFSGNSMNANQNFCIASNGLHKDLEVIVTNTTNARPGFTAKYKIIYRNKGNQTLSGAVAFNFNDNVLNFSSASTSPNSQTTGLLSWNYSNLLPFESREINATFVVNSPVQTPAVNIGDILTYTASITPMTGDDNSVDNQFTFNQTVVGSFDPNDKTCLEGNNVSPTKIGDYLHYNINFENTGTFQAENIVVKDIIDTTKFDINTIQIVNASHPVLLKTNENNVEFEFQNINLAAAQHGNVTFKIKTKSTLVTGNTVTNQANIYFDYNAPVTTNIASTTFQTLSNPEQEIDNTIRIYPNPTKNSVSITSSNEIKSVELYDIQGRVLTTKIVGDLTTTIDVSDKTNGIYFLKITSGKGIKIEKLIKE